MKRIDNPGVFLSDTGLLFEINRTLLHPLGLALEVTVEDDGSSRLSGIQDFRDDPEGLYFLDGDVSECAEKLKRFMASFGTAKHAQRRAALGYVVQPVVRPASAPCNGISVENSGGTSNG